MPWTDGRLSFALLELPESSLDPMAAPTEADVPSALITLGVSDPVAARAAIARLVEAGPGSTETTTAEHLGVTIHAATEGDGAYAVTDDHLLLATSADDIVAALDTRDGGETLAERNEMGTLVGALPNDWLAFGFFDFTDAMTTALDAAASESAESAAGAAAMARILEHQSLRAAFTVAATDEGLTFDSAGTPPTGPFEVTNAERGLADEVPGDTLYYAEGGNIGPALAEVIAAVKEAAATEPEVANGIDTAEAALGAELDELLAWIDDGALTIGWDGSEPYGGLVLAPSDRAAAQRRLDQLSTFAGLAALDPASGVTLTEAEVAGVTVTTIRWSDPAMTDAPDMGDMMLGAPTAVSVQYALTDERVLVGIGEAFVGRVLELDPADALAAEPRYTDAVADLGGPASTGVAWMDLAGVVAAVQEVAGPMFGEMGEIGEMAEVLAWLEPLDRIVQVSRLDGDVLIQRSVLIIR